MRAPADPEARERILAAMVKRRGYPLWMRPPHLREPEPEPEPVNDGRS